MKKSIYIQNQFANMRLDRWFKNEICNVPHSLIEKSIRKGRIKINNKKEKCSYKLKKDDHVILYNIDFSSSKNKIKTLPYKPTRSDLNTYKNIFIENNPNFAVINKPSGIAVQSGTKSVKNILDILKGTKEFLNTKPFTVHRIDKETTGLLIVAKNRKYAQLFTSLFRLRKIHKSYLGIVVGSFDKTSGILRDNLFYFEGDKKVKSLAITHFKSLDSNNKYSLLLLKPETGRKHQLRKQLLLHGHPILGDLKYRTGLIRNKNKSSLMLHAYKISFMIDNIKYNYVSIPPLTFTKTLKEKHLKNVLK
tara:strand:+ start:417 stop:1334 length:918 start_codon:yes stop_codon:yes gene_type:complete